MAIPRSLSSRRHPDREKRGTRYARLKPETVLVAFPAELQVDPQYDLAVLKEARPEAALLALTILSPEGQAILARSGFKPIGLPANWLR